MYLIYFLQMLHRCLFLIDHMFMSIVMEWVKTSDILRQSSLSFSDQLKLVTVTHDRAALVADIPDSWFSFRLDEVRSLAQTSVPEFQRTDPRRFLPTLRSRASGETWSSYVSSVRPHGWHWIEVMAARGPISLSAVTQAIESVFRANSFYDRPAMHQLSL
jgi:hypothetical protein